MSDFQKLSNRQIAYRIVQLMDKKKLTEDDVAAALDVSRQTVSGWCSGSVSIKKVDHLIDLANLLGTTPDYLLGYTGIPQNKPQARQISAATGLSFESIKRLKVISKAATPAQKRMVNAFIESGAIVETADLIDTYLKSADETEAALAAAENDFQKSVVNGKHRLHRFNLSDGILEVADSLRKIWFSLDDEAEDE